MFPFLESFASADRPLSREEIAFKRMLEQKIDPAAVVRPNGDFFTAAGIITGKQDDETRKILDLYADLLEASRNELNVGLPDGSFQLILPAPKGRTCGTIDLAVNLGMAIKDGLPERLAAVWEAQERASRRVSR